MDLVVIEEKSDTHAAWTPSDGRHRSRGLCREYRIRTGFRISHRVIVAADHDRRVSGRLSFR
jgi:hypothetical protein